VLEYPVEIQAAAIQWTHMSMRATNKNKTEQRQASPEAPVVLADRVDALVDAGGPVEGHDGLEAQLGVGLAGAQGAAAQGVRVAVDDLGGKGIDGAYVDSGGAPGGWGRQWGGRREGYAGA